MTNARADKLAELLTGYSCALKAGEKVLIEAINTPIDTVISLIRAAKAVGATPLVSLKDDQVIAELASVYTKDDVMLMAACELHTLRQVDAFISIRAVHNPHEYSHIPAERLANILQYYIQPVHNEYRNQNLRWVALRWPTLAMAERAQMTLAAFEDFFFNMCLIDYARLEAAMNPLMELMARTEKVRIVGPADTDISFSILGMPQYKSAGRHNIPDGELFTAPIKNSLNGRIRYNVPSVYYGTTFEDVCLDFRNGRIVDAVSSETRKLNEILGQDEGARYVGEFAFGLNPSISRPIQDILFDEKIAGSIHLAPGNAYPNCNNGNKSAIHWDLILIQNPEWGGGEVFFDGTLVRESGRFVLPELAGLNPERLIG
jgi:aminopeptidase